MTLLSSAAGQVAVPWPIIWPSPRLLSSFSALAMHNRTLAYGLLLVATCCLGIGFGLTVPAINTFAAAFFPRSVDSAVLALNALMWPRHGRGASFCCGLRRTRNLVGAADPGRSATSRRQLFSQMEASCKAAPGCRVPNRGLEKSCLIRLM